ncbi:hypothetical protein [Jannaschia aquimarina]|uniref:Uncharacterized protein n=1 Tax=Jannaschia aquimarina TaxID=935700 RepID=A0A0D1EBA9_9RHOB|nr:hypothetical protein [Jannaschia aquimarina]KIT15034.1 hypothetical protein jaqu_33600 [Jannaschia aquimarina]SNS62429.1 hypothetical protein SAMN05421775_101686 [Jannaschia aquimarina]
MIVVTADTIRNPAILEVRQLPRRFVDRVTVWPRNASVKTVLRLLAEMQLLRFASWLAPLVVIALIWRGAALPLSQAPVLMVVLVAWAEMRLLRASPRRRAAMDRDAAARTRDLMTVQGRAALTRIAAGRDLRSGALRLVVEQSPLRLLPPLTFVTVQAEDPPRVLDLTEKERAILHEELFQAPLTEPALHEAATAEDEFLQEVVLDARGLSAHARLSAALASDRRA